MFLKENFLAICKRSEIRRLYAIQKLNGNKLSLQKYAPEPISSISAIRRRSMVSRAGTILSMALIGFAVAISGVAAEKRDLTDMSLQDLLNIEIFSASKFLQKASEAPASIDIITADEIARYGYRNINDVLRSVPGFYVTNDRNYSYIGARGFARPGDYNSRLLLLVDGKRLNDNVYDSFLAGEESPVDIDLISRIEVIRGPSSSLYGASAFFGIINIVTKTGVDFAGTEVSAEAASYDRYKGRITTGTKLHNGVEFLLSATVLDSHGQGKLLFPEYNDRANNFGFAENADAERKRNIFASFSFQNWSARAGHNSRKKIIPTGSFDTVFNTDRTFTIDSHTFADLKYDRVLAGDLGLSLRMTYDRSRYHGDYLYDYSETEDPVFVINRDGSQGEFWGAEFQLTKRFLQKHRFTSGLDYRNNIHQDQDNYDVDPYVSYLSDRRNSDVWAAYLQDEYSIIKDLVLSAGLRYDHYQSFGGTTNPRIGLIYGGSRRTTVKALYGQAFRAPNVYELYYKGGISKDNPLLKPESIRTWELVFERSLGQSVRLSSSVYDYTIKNLITQDMELTSGMLVYENAQKVNAKGLEIQLTRKDANGIQMRLSYTAQRALDADSHEPLSNSPRQVTQASLIAPFVKGKLFASFETLYMGRRRTLSGKAVDSFMVSNLAIFSHKLFRNFELSAGLYNVFDKRYSDPGSEEHRQNSIEQDGRTFRVKIAYRIPFAKFEDGK
jgi:outer membrane receptor for ferrienterochelin and colicins